ncbi:hypothetical protein [Xanthobacter sediminis]
MMPRVRAGCLAKMPAQDALPCAREPLLSARPAAAARCGMRHLTTAVVIRTA